MSGRVSRSRTTQPEALSVRTFRAIADRYVAETFERFPTRASSAGVREFNSKLELPTLALFGAHEKLLRRCLHEIEELPEVDFTGDDWLDRRALLAELRTELWSI